MRTDTRTASERPPQNGAERAAWIRYRLNLKGLSLRRLGLAKGVNTRAIQAALQKQYPEMELYIAEELGLQPREIWPERYHEDGCPNTKQSSHFIRTAYPHWRAHRQPRQGRAPAPQKGSP